MPLVAVSWPFTRMERGGSLIQLIVFVPCSTCVTFAATGSARKFDSLKF